MDRRRGGLGLALVAGVLAAGLPLLTAAAAGALGIPRNDDWVYARAAFRTVREGHLVLETWTKALLVGQLELAVPVVRVLGERYAPLQVLVAFFGGLGVAATAHLLRRFLPTGWVALAVATLVLGPLWATLAASFMTDVPALAVQAVALVPALWALEPLERGEPLRAGPWLASLGTALVAFSIREYAVAVPLATAAVALLLGARRRRRDLALVLGGLLAWVGVAGALYAWRQGLAPALEHGVAPLSARSSLALAARSVLTLGALALPLAGLGLLLLLRPRRRVPRWALLGGAAVAVVGAWVVVTLHPDRTAPLGNHLRRSTSYPEASANLSAQHLGSPLWTGLVVLGAVATLSALVLALPRPVRARGSRGGTGTAAGARAAVALALAYVVAVVLVSVGVGVLTSGSVFDRYLLPAVPLVVGLGLHRARSAGLRPRAVTAAAVAGLVPLAAYGVHQTTLTATHDAVRWRTGLEVAALGFPADAVDAGYEWFSDHQRGRLGTGRTPAVPGAGFWTGLFTPARVCVVTAERGTPMGWAGVGDPFHETRGRSLLGTEVAVEAYRVPGSCPEVP